ncbi:MAG: hypothetical protein IPP44_23015 [Ideonella sp.]|nr:hypothetical protein [Ideonella sp.]
MLAAAAVRALAERPELVASVLATLDHWDDVAPEDSKPLRDEWRSIIETRQWQRALGLDEHAKQLRQSSPLGRALSPRTRLEIIRACKGRSSNT